MRHLLTTSVNHWAWAATFFLVAVFGQEQELFGYLTDIAKWEPQQPPTKPLYVEDPETELKAGLVAEYKSLSSPIGRETLVRVDAKPSFTWGTSSPHPRIAPGEVEVTWTGLLDLRAADRV